MPNILNKTKEFVLNLFKEKLPSTFLYHNYSHTECVCNGVDEIIENTDLNEENRLALKLAALLHDTGYTVTIEGHEDESVKIATNFLKEHGVDDKIIDTVNRCILATKLDSAPTTSLEKIMKDADTSHFGKDNFNNTSEFLRRELDILCLKKYSPKEWLDENIQLLSEKHQFYTDYALKNWQSQKDINTEDLKNQLKNENPERGIQTFFRVALKNHIKLSEIADTKANILLSVNAIIISLVLSNLISKLDSPSNNYLIIPTLIFTISSVVSMVLSVIATRPNITSGEFTKEDVEQKRVNLTFFGNFHKMELKEYQWAISELIKDKTYLYDSMTKDLYFLGKVLDRKYRILRITYNIFMTGMIISVIAFIVAFKLSNG